MNSTPFDALSARQLADHTLAWLRAAGTPRTDLAAADSAYHQISPRSVFLRNLPVDAQLLDLGAGDGSLSVYRDWPTYPRQDLKMYALSLDKGAHFDRYDGYELKNFEHDDAIFPGLDFQAIVCAHFIEHMHALDSTIAFFHRRLATGGRAYIEWPHPVTKKLPPRDVLLRAGVDISTTNFFDDPTHVQPWEMADVVRQLDAAGFLIESTGRTLFPYLAQEMRDHGAAERDAVRTTVGYWNSVGWGQFLIAVKR